jgi:hypothetical protein
VIPHLSSAETWADRDENKPQNILIDFCGFFIGDTRIGEIIMTHRQQNLFLLVFGTVFYLWGCAHSPRFDLDLGPARSPEEVIERVNRNALRVESLRAEVHLDSDQIPQSRLARAEFLFARPDHYRVRFRSLFGTTAAVFTIKEGLLRLYVPMSNRYYEGHLTVEQVGTLLGIEVEVTELMEALSGMALLPPTTDLLEYRANEDGHFLVFSWQEGRQEVQVAPDGIRVLEVRYRDDRGRTALTKRFSHHRLVDGVVRPGEVSAAFGGRGGDLKIVFIQQDVNIPWDDDDFLLDVPDSVERIELDREYR